MSGKNVAIDLNPINHVSSLFVSEVYLTGISGTSRVRKGMFRSFPPGLLTPTIPCYKI